MTQPQACHFKQFSQAGSRGLVVGIRAQARLFAGAGRAGGREGRGLCGCPCVGEGGGRECVCGRRNQHNHSCERDPPAFPYKHQGMPPERDCPPCPPVPGFSPSDLQSDATFHSNQTQKSIRTLIQPTAYRPQSTNPSINHHASQEDRVQGRGCRSRCRRRCPQAQVFGLAAHLPGAHPWDALGFPCVSGNLTRRRT